MRPADALAYRQSFIEHADAIAKLKAKDRPTLWDAIHQPVLHLARRCPVYYVASDMVTLAESAARTLPKTTVAESLLASRSGWMIYDRPFAEFRPDKGEFEMDGTPLMGMAWECVPLPLGYDANGDRVIAVPGEMTPCIVTFPLAKSPVSGVIMPISFLWREIGSDLDDSFAADKSLERKFYATQILMQQTIAWIEAEVALRSFRRRAARGRLAASNITVVKLRKLEKGPEQESGNLVAWSHRWLVNGHWRQQWYPSRREHRPMWISPHVKGPADKPFVAKDRVIAWVR